MYAHLPGVALEVGSRASFGIGELVALDFAEWLAIDWTFRPVPDSYDFRQVKPVFFHASVATLPASGNQPQRAGGARPPRTGARAPRQGQPVARRAGSQHCAIRGTVDWYRQALRGSQAVGLLPPVWGSRMGDSARAVRARVRRLRRVPVSGRPVRARARTLADCPSPARAVEIAGGGRR